jgi:protein gp37
MTWNPVHGCSRVSPGCKNCYAERQSLRFGHTKKPWTARNASENVLIQSHKLHEASRSFSSRYRRRDPAGARTPSAE